MGNTLESAIASIMDGELRDLPTILSSSHSEIENATTKLPQLSVSRSSLIKVLSEWRLGHITADDVQRWASFVKRGYVSGKAIGRLRPINIQYDAVDEDLIVEIVGRLDEIGDQVDGFIDDNEQNQMLQTLKKA